MTPNLVPVHMGPGPNVLSIGSLGQLRLEAEMPEFPTITHVALTVTDLGRSVPWYEALVGSKPVLDEDTGPFRHVVWLLGGQTLLGLHQFPDPASGEPFNERRVGLDHLAFACATRQDLERWEARLNELGVA